MGANFNLRALLAEPPKLHENHIGKLIADFRIDDATCFELNRRLKPGMKTLETGAGLSTIIFAANGCEHTCIVPDGELVERIHNFCRSENIDTSNIRFIISKSCDVIHQEQRASYDLILIDGCHGFPSIFVDFCYATKALRIGGTLIVDDMHIYTCNLTANFMQSDLGWNVDTLTNRVAVGIKISDTIDNEWENQPFVVSWGNKNLKSLIMATVKTFRARGIRVTLEKIFRLATAMKAH